MVLIPFALWGCCKITASRQSGGTVEDVENQDEHRLTAIHIPVEIELLPLPERAMVGRM